MTQKDNEIDRVRRNTSAEDLKRIDEEIERNIRAYSAGPKERLDQRIQDLQREWSMERYLETNASIVGLSSAFLAMKVNRKWLLLTAIVSGFLLQHAIQGWCPPVWIFRKRGVRTRGEIDREMYALKALRGDFRAVEPVQDHGAATRACQAAIA